MKFKFPFQSLLDHRKRLQDMANKDYADAMYELNDQKQKLESNYQKTTDARQFRFIGEQQGSAMELLKSVDVFTQGQAIRIEEQRKVVREHQQIVEKKFEALREAAVAFKIVEKLKEKQVEEFKAVKKKRELKEMDDLVSMRAKWRTTE